MAELAEVHQHSPGPEERQLCTSCVTPNDPAAHFCSKCGAPLSSFATIAPFEHLFAEGFIYREAAERPRNWVTILGVWLIFGMNALIGLLIMSLSRVDHSTIIEGGGNLPAIIFGGITILFSLAIIWKSTRNYMARKETESKCDA